MSCNHCGTSRCTCGQVSKHQSCCKTKTVCPDAVVTVNHGDVFLSGNAGPVMTAERSFSIPGCDEQGKISVYGEVDSPPAGSLIYISSNSKTAYLTVISTTKYYEQQSSCSNSCNDSSEKDQAYRTEFTVLNSCLSCSTLDAGAFLDQGTTLIIGPPDCSVTATGSSDLVLCDLLHVPEVGESEVIKISPSTSSLEIGDIIQITDKKFQVESVPSSTTVEVTNLGEGGDPGTIIDGCDCLSIRIYVIAGDSPCSKTPVEEADYVMVCDGSNQTILELEDGEVVGQVSGKVVGVPLPTDETVSTTFQGCIVLNPAADPQEYPLIVDDATDFAVGDKVYFDCDEDEKRFEITAIVGTTFTLVPDETPTEVGTVADDCDDCKLVKGDCCEALQATLESLQEQIDCLKDLIDVNVQQIAGVSGSGPINLPNAAAFSGNSSQQAYAHSNGTVVAGLPVVANLPSVTITNGRTCPMWYDVTLAQTTEFARVANNGRWESEMGLSWQAFAGIDFAQSLTSQSGVAGMGAINSGFVDNTVSPDPRSWGEDKKMSSKVSYVIQPGDSLTLHYIGRVLTIDPGGNAAQVADMPVSLEINGRPHGDGATC